MKEIVEFGTHVFNENWSGRDEELNNKEWCCKILQIYTVVGCERHGDDCAVKIFDRFEAEPGREVVTLHIKDGSDERALCQYCPFCGTQLVSDEYLMSKEFLNTVYGP